MGPGQAGKTVSAVSRTAVSERDSRVLQPARSGHQFRLHVSLGCAEAPGSGGTLRPVQGNPKFRYGLNADLRGENWDIRNSFQGPAPLLGSLNLRREAVARELCVVRERALAAGLPERKFRIATSAA